MQEIEWNAEMSDEEADQYEIYLDMEQDIWDY